MLLSFYDHKKNNKRILVESLLKIIKIRIRMSRERVKIHFFLIDKRFPRNRNNKDDKNTHFFAD